MGLGGGASPTPLLIPGHRTELQWLHEEGFVVFLFCALHQGLVSILWLFCHRTGHRILEWFGWDLKAHLMPPSAMGRVTSTSPGGSDWGSITSKFSLIFGEEARYD